MDEKKKTYADIFTDDRCRYECGFRFALSRLLCAIFSELRSDERTDATEYTGAHLQGIQDGMKYWATRLVMTIAEEYGSYPSKIGSDFSKRKLDAFLGDYLYARDLKACRRGHEEKNESCADCAIVGSLNKCDEIVKRAESREFLEEVMQTIGNMLI